MEKGQVSDGIYLLCSGQLKIIHNDNDEPEPKKRLSRGSRSSSDVDNLKPIQQDKTYFLDSGIFGEKFFEEGAEGFDVQADTDCQ